MGDHGHFVAGLKSGEAIGLPVHEAQMQLVISGLCDDAQVGAVDIEIHREEIPVERKTFSFSLRQNPRGRFLKITEDVGGRRDTIIMPSTGLPQLRLVIENIIQADQKAGPVVPPLPQVFEGTADE